MENSNKLIYLKMSEIMKEIGPVSKSQTNTFQNYKFRGIDQFVNALHPALIKARVFMVPECVKESHEIREKGPGKFEKDVSLLMKYHFFAEDGSSVTVGPIPGEGIDSSDKATNKALSASLKYSLINTFAIPTEDMTDGDSDHIPLTAAGMKTANFHHPSFDTQPGIETSDPQTYVVPFGKKYKGVRLIDIPKDERLSYRSFLLNSKTPLTEQAEEFIYLVDLLDEEPNNNFPSPNFGEEDVRY